MGDNAECYSTAEDATTSTSLTENKIGVIASGRE